MHTLYVVSVWLHIVAATIWVGGMFFLGLAVVPVARGLSDRRLASQLTGQIAQRFRPIGWWCLALLLLTGALNLHARGVGAAALVDPAFWGSPFGTLLGGKLALFSAIVALSVYHDASLGPRAIAELRADPSSPAAQRLRAQASWMGRFTLLVSLVIVALAVGLVRGC